LLGIAEIEPSLEQQDPQPDFLAPIHIRQEGQSTIPLLTHLKLIEPNEDIPPNYLQNFHRICSINNNNDQIDPSKLQVYCSTLTFSRKHVFGYFSSFIFHLMNVKWNYFNNTQMMI
jgi:hypothetical protein